MKKNYILQIKSWFYICMKDRVALIFESHQSRGFHAVKDTMQSGGSPRFFREKMPCYKATRGTISGGLPVARIWRRLSGGECSFAPNLLYNDSLLAPASMAYYQLFFAEGALMNEAIKTCKPSLHARQNSVLHMYIVAPGP